MIDKPNVLCIKWKSSDYDSLNGLSTLLSNELSKIGFNVYPVEVNLLGNNDFLQTVQSMKWKFAFGLSGVGAKVIASVTTSEGISKSMNLWQAFGIPYFDWKCDHPCHNSQAHTIEQPYILHGYVFPDHADFALDALNANGGVYPLHIGIPGPEAFPSVDLPAKARNGRILFCKSGGNALVQKQSWDSLSEPLGQTLRKVALQVEHETINSRHYPQLIRKVGIREGLILADDSALMMSLLRELEVFERSRRSEMVVQSLLNYPIDVFGRGWDHINFGNKSRWVSKGIAFHEVLDLMPYYSGILNTNPLVDESVHDRVFFGLGCGTAILTDKNEFVACNMESVSEHHFEYQSSSIQRAADNLLSTNNRAIDITVEARKILFDNYSMARTARVMSEICSSAVAILNKKIGN